MVAIPAGAFLMGADDLGDDAKPVHAVTVAAFFMDRNEVTVAAYKRCTSCSPPDATEYCNWGKSGRDNHPVNCVDWNQATAFCTSVGKRLPTEEEWEYAACGTMGRMYPWGNTPPSDQFLCWGGSYDRQSSCPVDSYPAGRNHFDQLGKQIGKEALGSCGSTVVSGW
jgi:formylglycine-generating enzyme required for sulfatase activity